MRRGWWSPVSPRPLADIVGESLVDGMVNCPFHHDQTPSCRIYEDHFHCFGCGAHGNHLDWQMQVEGIGREEARCMLETWDGPRQIQRREDGGETRCAYALRLWEEARPLRRLYGRARFPIVKLWGPAMPIEMVQGAMLRAFEKAIMERLPKLSIGSQIGCRSPRKRGHYSGLTHI